uniref:Uncharacterized protein n=1 Tax=Cacopsylla melanoneura TaxID=428564 RepID=A0A8D9ANZ7_9HEMI
MGLNKGRDILFSNNVLTVICMVWIMLTGVSEGFGNGIEDVTSDNLYNLLEPRIQKLIESKHLDPSELSSVTFDYTLLPTIYLYNGKLVGLSRFRNESVSSSWDRVSRMVHMELHLIFPELRMNYQWRSVIGSGHLAYIINDMLLDLSFILDLQNLKLKIDVVRFNNKRATTDMAVKSRIVTSILNALRGQLKGLNNWILNPVTDKMNTALLAEVEERNIDIYELLGIKHLYNRTSNDIPKT